MGGLLLRQSADRVRAHHHHRGQGDLHLRVREGGCHRPLHHHPGHLRGQVRDHEGDQVCHEEYQTQAYKVPLVTAPLEVTCSLAYPAPKKVCVTYSIDIDEVKCEDKIENRCFNVAKFVDATNVVDQVETVIGEPKCDQVTLSLPTQTCSKAHHAPVHHAPAYHGK